ncbi:MAG: hypothetical protein LCH90_23060, partial [Proteobacteria bacterium]|nr:hypothetical protein [Pseudomonadota bacterium]
VTGNATVAQAVTIDGATNSGTNTYNINDTAALIAASNNTLLATAGTVTANTNATATQATTIAAFAKAVVYSISDTAANIVAATAGARNEAVNITATGTTTTWNMHLGSTGCKGDPTKGVVTACTNPNRMDFSFAAFNASTQKIVLDLAELFKYSDLSHEGGGAAGCMSGTSDPECPGIFQALQINLANGLPINGGAAQTVFSVKSK